MAALIEIAESMLEILEEGGAKPLPVIDIVVEGIRGCLRVGYDRFQRAVDREFEMRLEDPSVCKKLVKKFYAVNKLRIAELVLSEREIG